MTHRRFRYGAERGFTLIETMIAIVIMSVGILTVVAAFATAVGATQNAQENLIARQKALEAMESIFTARNTQQITFAQIANTASGGIFTNGATPLWDSGDDGSSTRRMTLRLPPMEYAWPAGVRRSSRPDGILGTADDVAMSLGNFTRQIQISPVLEADGVTIDPNLKQITVTVSYSTGTSTVPRSYSVNALISAFR